MKLMQPFALYVEGWVRSMATKHSEAGTSTVLRARLGALALLLSVAFIAGRVSADPMELIKADGKFWNGLSSSERITVVPPSLSAYSTGWTVGFQDGQNAKNPKYAGAPEPKFSRSFGFYENSITDFYLRYPDSGYQVGAVLACLADQPRSYCQDLLVKGAIGK